MHDEFWAAIEQLVPTPIDRGGRDSVHGQLAIAFQAGWTPKALSRWLGEQVGAASRRLSNPSGFVIARLREIPAQVPTSQRDLDDARALRAREVAAERAAAREACPLCDADGYIGTQRCDHDPKQLERNQAGAARAREALTSALAARRATTHSGRLTAPPEPRTDGRAAR